MFTPSRQTTNQAETSREPYILTAACIVSGPWLRPGHYGTNISSFVPQLKRLTFFLRNQSKHVFMCNYSDVRILKGDSCQFTRGQQKIKNVGHIYNLDFFLWLFLVRFSFRGSDFSYTRMQGTTIKPWKGLGQGGQWWMPSWCIVDELRAQGPSLDRYMETQVFQGGPQGAGIPWHVGRVHYLFDQSLPVFHLVPHKTRPGQATSSIFHTANTSPQ